MICIIMYSIDKKCQLVYLGSPINVRFNGENKM